VHRGVQGLLSEYLFDLLRTQEPGRVALSKVGRPDNQGGKVVFEQIALLVKILEEAPQMRTIEPRCTSCKVGSVVCEESIDLFDFQVAHFDIGLL
jgi:hypothetical protein